MVSKAPSPHRRNLFTLVLLALLWTSSSLAQQPQLSEVKRTQIEAAVTKYMATTHVPGLSVAVVENGEYEWAAGFGLADAENNAPASEHTLFRLASISMSLTATAAMQLVERKQLDLDAPVQKYCPAFPQKQSPITTRLVMGHLAGVRHYKSGSQDDLEVGNTKHFDDPIQAGLDFFKNDPLVSDPGKQFHYSTQGYTLVGCVVEGASQAKYVDFVRKNVFVPAGMDNTQVDNRFAIIPYRTRFYRKTESGTVQNTDFLDSSYKIPGGGWLSYAEDMAKFEVAILNDKLIKRSTRDLDAAEAVRRFEGQLRPRLGILDQERPRRRRPLRRSARHQHAIPDCPHAARRSCRAHQHGRCRSRQTSLGNPESAGGNERERASEIKSGGSRLGAELD